MRRSHSTILIFGFALTMGLLAGWYVLHQHLLVLEDGRYIETEDVWVTEDRVFYRRLGKVDYVSGIDVKKWVVRFSLSMEDLGYRTAFIWNRLTQPAEPLPHESSGDGRKSTDVLVSLGEIGIRFLPELILIVLCILLFRIRRKKPAPAPVEVETAEEKPKEKPRTGPMLLSLDEVADFFLKIYKIQIGGNLRLRGKIEPLPSSGASSGRLYELHVNMKGKWKSRRVTIRPLGEGTSSKSQCFYAIYDTHIVIKIPPTPIQDFDDYISRMQYEQNIATAVAPRKSIIPNVSVIMDKVYRIENRERMSLEQIEKHFVQMLENSYEYHKCLQIKDAYVFFMTLSTDYFLGDAMTHLRGEDLFTIVEEDAGGGYGCRGFEARYGSEYNWVCLELNRLYDEFDEEFEQLKTALGSRTATTDEQKREWFFFHMAKLPGSKPAQGHSERLHALADELLTNLTNSKIDLVRTYRQLLHKHARQRSFNRNRQAVEAIIWNLMELLDWLDKSHVALRDLKPDNLLVVGDPSQYPLFLSSAEEFRIGLIDLETAVDYSTRSNRPCPQPQLGGTPAFATPTHFVTNKILGHFYPDIGTILHLQDWYALVGIIFELVTGRRLFQRTAGHIQQIVRGLQDVMRKRHSIRDFYTNVNGLFWQQAENELHEQIDRHGKQLRAITTILPETIKGKLAALLKSRLDGVEIAIHREIENQSYMKDEAQKKKLYDISSTAIRRTIKRYKESGKAEADQVSEFLQRLESLKKDYERYHRIDQRFEKPFAGLSVKDILILMMEHSAQAMDISVSESEPSMPPSMPEFVEQAPTEVVEEDASTLGFTHTVNLPSE